jgi:hypothetical protein
MTQVRVRPYVRRRFVHAPAEYLTKYKVKSQFEIQMRPDDFLRAVGPQSREHVTEEDVQKLMARMEADQEIDPLFLDVDPKRGVIKHEGRHRAVAAERLGIETVPVIVYIYESGEGYLEATPERTARAKRALGRGTA